ncbi:MAG: GNAT family N-acetyltransferase [Anaerofustis sp.]
MIFTVREAVEGDLPQLLELYTQLHPDETYSADDHTEAVWQKILSKPSNLVFMGCLGDRIVSSCHMVIIENLTHGNRPYAVIENVVTDIRYRKKGYATRLLNYAKASAQKEHCYKMMLMTSSKEEGTLNFYQLAGFNGHDKTGFVQWLD